MLTGVSVSAEPPPDAPRWWGCPKGQQCDWAHGEEELRSDAKIAAAEARREAALQASHIHHRRWLHALPETCV